MDVITTCRLVYVSLCVSPFFNQCTRRLNCFNDQLVYTFYFGSFPRQLVCLSCKEVVRKPQTRMKLVVFLSGTSKCDSTPLGHVSQPLPPESKVSVEVQVQNLMMNKPGFGRPYCRFIITYEELISM